MDASTCCKVLGFTSKLNPPYQFTSSAFSSPPLSVSLPKTLYAGGPSPVCMGAVGHVRLGSAICVCMFSGPAWLWAYIPGLPCFGAGAALMSDMGTRVDSCPGEHLWPSRMVRAVLQRV